MFVFASKPALFFPPSRIYLKVASRKLVLYNANVVHMDVYAEECIIIAPNE